MPLSRSSLPVRPVASQLGDHLQRIARLQLLHLAIRRTFSAPAMNSAVLSMPVTYFRFDFSEQVSHTRCFLRLHGWRGTDKPPRSSGHTGMSTTSGLSMQYRFTNDEYPARLPCHRQGSFSRQADTSTYCIFLSKTSITSILTLTLNLRKEFFNARRTF